MQQSPSSPNQPPFNPQYPQGQPSPYWGNTPPSLQQGYPQQQYQPYQQPPPAQPLKKKYGKGLLITVIVLAVLGVGFIANALATPDAAPKTATMPKSTHIVQPTHQTASPTPTPVPPTAQPIHYPPTTVADLHDLAAKGTADVVHEFHSESVGAAGVCPQPKREVTVDPSVTGQQLAEDLLAYFYAQQLDSPCGSVVFAYHNQGEANDVYTAGRILVNVTDSSGAMNIDPNANNLKHQLTLDIGGDFTNKEYVVTY